MKKIALYMVLGVLLSVSQAQAVIIGIDADPFAPGTVLNNQFLAIGAALSAFGTSTDGNVYARTSTLATTGDKVFGNSSGFDPLWIPGGRTLRVDFTNQTDFVSIDFIGNDTSDKGTFEIFNNSNVSIGLLTTGLLNMTSQTLSFNRVSSDIAYMTATGFGTDNVALDNIQFNAIPEPSTLLLLGLGCAGLGLVARYRRRQ